MAKRSAAHLVKYQFPRASAPAPIVIRQTRLAKPKKTRRRHGGGGSGLGLGAIVMAELALKVAEPIILGFIGNAAPGVPQPILIAAVAHFTKADKYVKGIQLLTKFKAVESFVGGMSTPGGALFGHG